MYTKDTFSMKNMNIEKLFFLMWGTIGLADGISAIIAGIAISQPNNQLLIFMSICGIILFSASGYCFYIASKQ